MKLKKYVMHLVMLFQIKNKFESSLPVSGKLWLFLAYQRIFSQNMTKLKIFNGKQTNSNLFCGNKKIEFFRCFLMSFKNAYKAKKLTKTLFPEDYYFPKMGR